MIGRRRREADGRCHCSARRFDKFPSKSLQEGKYEAMLGPYREDTQTHRNTNTFIQRHIHKCTHIKHINTNTDTQAY